METYKKIIERAKSIEKCFVEINSRKYKEALKNGVKSIGEGGDMPFFRKRAMVLPQLAYNSRDNALYI
ncbi:hypothetical protein ACUL41_00190 [Virgibacillus natechei]